MTVARTAAGFARRLDRGLVLAACDRDIDPTILEQLARWEHGGAADVLPAVVTGPVERGLHSLAEARGAPLVVVGSRRGGTLDRRIGSRLIRDARRPLAIVPVGDDARTRASGG
jgi:hypothetical protein